MSRAWKSPPDYDSEYRYQGRPIPALQGLDPAVPVILAGSFSKILFPTLRIGYLVVPPAMVDKFAAARLMTDRHSPVPDQATLCDFIREGHLGSHIRRMRSLYAERLEILRSAVQRKLSGMMRIGETAAGVHAIGWLAPGWNAATIAQAAAAKGIETLPLSRCVLKAARPQGLLLGFAAFDARQIQRGVDALASAMESLRTQPAIGPAGNRRMDLRSAPQPR